MKKRNEQLQMRLRILSPRLKRMQLRPYRDYKDRLFRMIYKDKKKFLELYNALNGTNYDNPDDLIVKTLENAIYLGMKNDVAFLLYDELALYEHQSTLNPNMPLRDLFYVSRIYEEIIKDEDLYGKELIRIPKPQFVVFYNGVEKTPEQFELKLSDAYGEATGEIPLELRVKVYNINYGHSKELMEKCKSLQDYAIFVAKSRAYSKQMNFADAIELTIAECIQEDVMADFLRKQRAEVLNVSIFEFNEKAYIKGVQRKGSFLMKLHLIRKKMEKGLSVAEMADILEEKEEEIQSIYDLLSAHAEESDEALYERYRRISK